MDERNKENLKEILVVFVRQYLRENKIFHDTFAGLGSFFATLNIAQNKNYAELFDNHLVDSIVTSLLIYLDNNPAIEIKTKDNTEIINGKDVIIEQIQKAINVAKTTFAYAINEFQKTDKHDT